MLRFRFISIFFYFFTLISLTFPSVAENIIDLTGEWNFRLLDAPDSITSVGTIHLPASLAERNIGFFSPRSENTDHLVPKYHYTGRAAYSRVIDVPDYPQNSSVVLSLERSRPSIVMVDGMYAGGNNVISAPQSYDLSDFLSPGRHLIEIIVDNGEAIPAAVRSGSHACSESTQTNWNGILGDISLHILDPIRTSDISIVSAPDATGFLIRGKLVSNNASYPLSVIASAEKDSVAHTFYPGDVSDFELFLPVSADVSSLWSEWNPALRQVTISVKDTEGNVLNSSTITTGLRNFSTDSSHFRINGDLTFLRGRHDACVAPATAHVPMDIDYWRRYFSILRDYGINHVRFHSWCPPDACFTAADEAGVYLQPELSIWGEIDKEQTQLIGFLSEDMEAILKAYSHHPSFVMFAIGNELWGEIPVMKSLIDHAREMTPGLLATYGSNIYLGFKGDIEGEDYLVTVRVGSDDNDSAQVRGSFSFADDRSGGIINSMRPNTIRDFSRAAALSSTPVIGHETGQYQIYPDFSTIPKFSGVLRPDNLITFRNRAAETGTLPKNKMFADASGQWAVRLYKEEMELALRTPNMAGFQLLDLQDYPGQGTALVGILDSFMDSKGIVSPDIWRESCNDISLLALLPARTFHSGEAFDLKLSVADYSDRDLEGESVAWELPFAAGECRVPEGKGVLQLCSVSLTAPMLSFPQKMTLNLSLKGEDIHNSYDIWIFPEQCPDNPKIRNKVTLTQSLDSALTLLSKGKNVILFPDSAAVASTSLPPLFITDFWNFKMFDNISRSMDAPSSPGTLGLLIDNKHPMFQYFPTDFHTDWQWWEIISNSRSLIIDRLPSSYNPVVEPIDNIDRSLRLAMVMEFTVGKGKLMVIMANPDKLNLSPEGRWFIASASKYMASKECDPRYILSPGQLKQLLTVPSAATVKSDVVPW